MKKIKPEDPEKTVGEFLIENARYVPESFMVRFDRYANPHTEFTAPGQPLNVDKVEMFKFADEYYRQTKPNYTEALMEAMRRFPDIRPTIKKHDDDNLPIETLVREYKRYRDERHPLLESGRTYVNDNFWICVRIEDWEHASAIFTRLTETARSNICHELNAFVAYNNAYKS